MIKVHHLNDSRSQRVLWLLEELGLDYEVVRYERDAKTRLAPPELIAVHPLGKSPVIEDGAIKVAETGAVVEYLLDAHGRGRLRPPPGTEEARRFTYWLHYAEGSAMPPLLLKLVFGLLPRRAGRPHPSAGRRPPRARPPHFSAPTSGRSRPTRRSRSSAGAPPPMSGAGAASRTRRRPARSRRTRTGRRLRRRSPRTRAARAATLGTGGVSPGGRERLQIMDPPLA